jgi:ADP-ribose pyrophosphatase
LQAEQRIDTKDIYEGRIIKVRVDTVKMPNDRETSREVVEHAAAVVLVPIDDEDNVILVRQYRYAAGRTLLEAPAGIVEPSESPGDCAQRELQEEIGYRANTMRPLGGFWSSPGFCTEYMYAFLAKGLVPSKLDADDDESINVEKFPLSAIPRLIRVGEIEDAKTIAALLMVTCLLKDA